MSKRLPLCAYCGQSLRFSGETKHGRVTLEWAGLKGHPIVGWHGECSQKDDLYRLRQDGPYDDVEQVLDAIYARGANRVSASSDRWKERI